MSEVNFFAAAESLERAKKRLETAIRNACPGEEHKYVQHRDANPPWCPACHRTPSGRVIRT